MQKEDIEWVVSRTIQILVEMEEMSYIDEKNQDDIVERLWKAEQEE